MAIKVRLKTLKNGQEEIIHPETDWSIVLNRPSITVDSNGEKWDTSGSYICLKENGIYVKDYRSNGVLLENYPIKWSAVQKRPNITVTSDGSLQTWSTSGSGIRLSGNKIYIKDYNSSEYSLLENYPINIKWSAISGRPNYLPDDQSLTTFGRYVENEQTSGNETRGTVYPAIRTFKYQIYGSGQPNYYDYTYYYFINGSWTPYTGGGEFKPGL